MDNPIGGKLSEIRKAVQIYSSKPLEGTSKSSSALLCAFPWIPKTVVKSTALRTSTDPLGASQVILAIALGSECGDTTAHSVVTDRFSAAKLYEKLISAVIPVKYYYYNSKVMFRVSVYTSYDCSRCTADIPTIQNQGY